MTQPMSRTIMQELKSQTDENIRQGQIKKIVEEIYNKSVIQASTTSETSFNFKIPPAQFIQDPNKKNARQQTVRSNNTGPADPFYIKNMPDILTGLHDLFPGCAVSHTLLCQAKDGKLYDIAKLNDSILPFVDRALDHSYIVIDWSDKTSKPR